MFYKRKYRDNKQRIVFNALWLVGTLSLGIALIGALQTESFTLREQLVVMLSIFFISKGWLALLDEAMSIEKVKSS